MATSARNRSLARWRSGFAVSALVLPLGLFLLFARQARRLDVLAARGRPAEAWVTSVADGTTFYQYRVDGIEYSWNVAQADAPLPAGQVFTATYLPDDPSLSRPFADRRLAAVEAARNRRLAWSVVLGLAATLLVLAGLVHLEVRRLPARASGLAEPQAYRRRLALLFAALVPPLVAVGAFHIADSVNRDQSVLPAVVAVSVVLGAVGCAFLLAARAGALKTRERASQVLRWIARR